MLRKLLNFILLANGVSAADDDPAEDKWERLRRERERAGYGSQRTAPEDDAERRADAGEASAGRRR